jgi:hypothetical protein
MGAVGFGVCRGTVEVHDIGAGYRDAGSVSHNEAGILPELASGPPTKFQLQEG